MRFFLSLFLGLILSLSIINAQAPNSLLIKLVDETNSLIEKATATLKDEKGKEINENIRSQVGIIRFSPLNKGVFILEIRSPGFKNFTKSVNVEKGENIIEVKLEIEQITETVVIELSKRERRFEEAINKVFTQNDINQLPSDSESIQKVLKRKYGNDVVMRVNGFTGGQFPDKSQIASITVILSPIDAEFRSVGNTVIDITTKVSTNKKWTGFLSLTVGNSIFDARNAFAKEKIPYNNQSTYFSINPPSLGRNTALSFSVFGINSKNNSIFLGQYPMQTISTNRDFSKISLFPSVTLNQNINKNNTLYFNYGYSQIKGNRIGLGSFDITERAYSNSSQSHSIKLSESATIGKYSNQIRFEYIESNSKTIPNSSEPSIIVLGVFNKGGAGNQSNTNTKKLSLINILSFGQKKHLIKIGGEVEFSSLKYQISSNTNGRFTFSNLANYLQNKPLLFEQRNGIASADFSQINTNLFLQDYFSVTKNFQLGIGIRWEKQSRVKDFNNFAPRLSFVWSPEKTGKLILRGGLGSLYTYLDTNFFLSVLSDDGTQSNELRILNPGFPNPFQSGQIDQEIEKPSISRLDKTVNPQMYVSFFGAILTPIDDIKLINAYISIKGTQLPRIRDANYFVNGIRPNPNFGLIKFYEFEGNNTANIFASKSEMRIKGFSINTSYTFTKSTVDFNDGGLPTDNNNLRLDQGPTDEDRNHEINVDTQFTLYRLIKYKPLIDINIYLSYSSKSGLPYTITTGRDDNNDGIINDRPLGINRNSEHGNWNHQTDFRINWKPNWSNKGKIRLLSKKITFSLDITNLFNQTNKQNFIGIQTSPFFRQATSAAPARTIQLGMSWMF